MHRFAYFSLANLASFSLALHFNSANKPTTRRVPGPLERLALHEYLKNCQHVGFNDVVELVVPLGAGWLFDVKFGFLCRGPCVSGRLYFSLALENHL